MKINIIVKQSRKDSFTLNEDESNKVLLISSINSSGFDKSSISHNIKDLLDVSKIYPSEDIIDFLNLGLAIYTIDQTVSRKDYGYYHWNRYFLIHLPVLNLGKWNKVKKELEETLSFLSGDRWEIHFRERDNFYKKNPTKENYGIDKVCLFSGGLDSFIGAVDLLEDSNIALVGHHKKGGKEKHAQEILIQNLKKEYKNKKVLDFLFYVQPKKDRKVEFGGEDSQRARSFLYITLGIAIANSLGDNIPLFIPENGPISLNISLTNTRQGTYSTKTTHPYFINRIIKVLQSLSIDNQIINPFQFLTKGEMIMNSKNIKVAKKLASKTISCSKPDYYRRWHGKDNLHCGHCVPCIIRRAALNKAKMDSANDYVFDVKTFDSSYNNSIGADLHAFKIAIYRYIIKNKLNFFELLKSGALPPEHISDYLSVAKSGLSEVNDFLQGK